MRADCDNNGVESRVLPALRASSRSGDPSISLGPDASEQRGSHQTGTEAWLEEAQREAGFSKPYTVSVCVWVSV